VTESHSRSGKTPFDNVSRVAVIGFIAIAVYFLIAEHRAHVLPFLPFLLFALCPLLHFFHHRGHRRSADESRDESSRQGPPAASGRDHH